MKYEKDKKELLEIFDEKSISTFKLDPESNFLKGKLYGKYSKAFSDPNSDEQGEKDYFLYVDSRGKFYQEHILEWQHDNVYRKIVDPSEKELIDGYFYARHNIHFKDIQEIFENNVRERQIQEREEKERQIAEQEKQLKEAQLEQEKRFQEVKEKLKPKGIQGDYYFTHEIREPSWIVDNILPDFGFVMLAAKKKLGKTWFCYDLASAIAKGTSFLGQRVKQGKVLYLDFETNDVIRKQRLQKYFTKDDLQEVNNITFFRDDDFVKLKPEKYRKDINLEFNFVDQLEWLLEDYPDTDVIIIDTVKKIRTSSGIKNVNLHDDEEAGRLQKFCQNHLDILVLITNHAIKGDAKDPFDLIEGSNSLAGATDINLIMWQDRGNNKKVLNTYMYVESRVGKNSEHIVKLDDNLRWKIVGDVGELENISEQTAFINDPIVKTINDMLKLNGNAWMATSKEVCDAVKTYHNKHYTPQKMKLLLQEMEQPLKDYCNVIYEFREYKGNNSNRHVFNKDTKQENFLYFDDFIEEE